MHIVPDMARADGPLGRSVRLPAWRTPALSPLGWVGTGPRRGSPWGSWWGESRQSMAVGIVLPVPWTWSALMVVEGDRPSQRYHLQCSCWEIAGPFPQKGRPPVTCSGPCCGPDATPTGDRCVTPDSASQLGDGCGPPIPARPARPAQLPRTHAFKRKRKEADSGPL